MRKILLISAVASLLLATGATSASAADPVNEILNPSAETTRTTNCPTATTIGSGGVDWTECPTFWFTAAHGGGVNTSTYEWATEGHTGLRSLKINGTGFDTNICTIGAPPPGSTKPRCGTAAWNYATTPVTPGTHYLYTNWYKATDDTELDATIQCADNTFLYQYLATIPPAGSWSPIRQEFDVPQTCASGSPVTRMSVYHLIYQNSTLQIDDISWGQYTQDGFNRGMVTVTLDDGFTNQYANSSILDNHGIKGTFFVITGELQSQPTYMSLSQMWALKNRGHDIQSHTVTHSNLTKLTPQGLDDELKYSQQTLGQSFGTQVGDLAAPYGVTNTDTAAAVSKYYQSQRTTDQGYNSKDYLDPYRLRVKSVKNTTTNAQIQSWVNEAKSKNLWLILVYHQITNDTSAGTFSTSVSDFDNHMSAIQNSGITNVTLNQGLQETAAQAGVTLNTVPPVSNTYVIPNASAEIADKTGAAPQGWTKDNWGTNTETFSWANDGHTGSKSVRIDMTRWTNGQAKWYASTMGAQGGKRYVYTDWYKSNVNTAVSVAYTTLDGVSHFDQMDATIPASTTWKQYSLGYVLPPDAISIFFMHNIGKVGWLEVDDVGVSIGGPGSLNRGLVSLTFDDGSPSIYSAVATLDTYGFKSTQYIPTGSLQWTSTQIKSLDTRGHEIGGHSVTHPDLTKVSDSQLKNELANSKKALENILKHPIYSFATPYGYYDQRVTTAVKAAGYTTHRSTDNGLNNRFDVNPWNVVVRNMYSTTTVAEYKSWVDQANQGKYWLVIVYHEVMNGSTGDAGLDKLTTTPANFKSELDYVRSSGITVKTLTSAWAEVAPQHALP